MILSGNNLGERHQDLNSKVAEAVANKTNFEELKSQLEQCDVDKLFKIKLASKQDDIDYILEVLKCGDVFHITHALKCPCLYSDEYSHLINTDYLDANIFSCMSEKMKRKMLTSISTNMTNANRSIDFYKYCKKTMLNVYAVKFLVKTTDNFKLNLLKESANFHNFKYSKYLKEFVGKSFVLTLAYLRLNRKSSIIIRELSFLYSVSDEQYLDILENYIDISARYPNSSTRLGIRNSRDILKRHKPRILKKPLLYINVLNKSMLVKFLTFEEVKSVTFSLLPDCTRDFWSLDFYKNYKCILDKFPASELFNHLKQIYISKYNDDEFEMTRDFYNLKYYEMLTVEEREAWALRHLERQKGFTIIEKYMWYKFVSLENAFSPIKRLIYITPDKDKRSHIVNILPETARNMEDINKILIYYYDRHVNESEDHKESFINTIIGHLDIYSFSDECWTSFDKLLYSLDVYTTGCQTRTEYKFRSMIYHILHGKELPEALQEFSDASWNCSYVIDLIEELSEERKTFVSKYYYSYCAEKIKSLMDHPDFKTENEYEFMDSSTINGQIQNYVSKIFNVNICFKRNYEDCPEIVRQYMEANESFYSYHEIFKTKFVVITEEDFVRWLKQDSQTAVDGIYEIRCNAYRWKFRLCRLFRKLKVYFPNDIGKEYLEYFTEYLADIPKGYRLREYRNIKMAVVGVFYLANSDVIINFLEKYVPTSPKIDHKNIDKQVLQVQKAICRLAYHARPPMPLSIFQKYNTGDYVHYCMPVFNNYFTNLQSNGKFIETLLNNPLSIQKHGLRLAFRSYNTDKLVPIIVSAWKKTKNVSLRMLLFQSLFDKILSESEELQKELYEVLKMYTSELNQDDHDSIFSLLVSDNFPNALKGDFIETAYTTVENLPDERINTQRITSVIRHMTAYSHLVEREFIRREIVHYFVADMLNMGGSHVNYSDDDCRKELNAKWDLTAKYLLTFTNEIDQEKTFDELQDIMYQFTEFWDMIHENTFIAQIFAQKFVKTLRKMDPNTVESCSRTVIVYQYILDSLQKAIKKEELYLLNWELQLSIACRNIFCNGRNKVDDRELSRNEIGKVYGKEVAKILINILNNNEFYSCFYQALADIINSIGCDICTILDTASSGFVYSVCDGLCDIKIRETHLLSLFMLPKDPIRHWEDEHAQCITKIKQFDNHEVRCFYYQKYVLSVCHVEHESEYE